MPLQLSPQLRRRLARAAMAAYLVGSVLFAVKRYHYFTIDGDLSSIVMGNRAYKSAMEDPFALNALLKDSVYAAPNRHFAHRITSLYFRHVPQLLQSFLSPISSLYYSAALAKALFQFLLIYLLACLASGKTSVTDTRWLFSAVLITPLFQVFGYARAVGIVDASITYSFFYAGMFVLNLLFLLPYFLYWQYGIFPGRGYTLGMIFLLPVAAFSGPLNPAVLLIASAFLLGGAARRRYAATAVVRPLPASWTVFLPLLALLASALSLMAGRNNAENAWGTLSLAERYALLPRGLWDILTVKLAWPLICAMILAQVILLRTLRIQSEAGRLLRISRWLLAACLVYIACLPLGGYRDYRPLIIRWDTFLPVTLSAILFHAAASRIILAHAAKKLRTVYGVALLAFSAVFFFADTEIRKENRCEKKALEALAVAREHPVRLDSRCCVLSWRILRDSSESELNAEFLQLLHVTSDRVLYYQD
jgi:hypothetical protein